MEMYIRSLEKSTSILKESYGYHLLSQALDFTGDELLMVAACVYLEAVKRRRVRGTLPIWGCNSDCLLSILSKNMWCPTFAICIKPTLCIVWLHTCRT